MISDDDRARLGDLAMRAIDTILEDYGEDATLTAATLVFEVKAKNDEGEQVWHGNYESLEDSSPSHVAGLLGSTAMWIMGTNE